MSASLENIKLFNTDCMIKMAEYPDKYFDLAIVDPPYGIGANKMTLGNGKRIVFRGGSDWDVTAPPIEYFNELIRVSVNQIIWGANHFVETLHLNSRAWIVWDKGTGDNDFADGELAWTSFDRVLKIFKKTWVGANAKDGIDRIHPTQKPIALYKWLLKNYSDPSHKIIDTHLGSGSSAIAAYDFGVAEFVGTEIDKDYYEAAVKRFRVHTMQYQMF